MKNLISIIGFVLFGSISYCQDSVTEPKVELMPYYSAWGGHLEYSRFNATCIGIGTDFLVEPLHKRIAGRQITYSFDCTLTGLFYNDLFAIGQRLDFGVNCEKLSPDLHVFFEHNNKNDFRIGGKIGISFGNFIYLHYRYCIPVGNYENLDISRHGVTLTLKLNWVAFSNLYGV